MTSEITIVDIKSVKVSPINPRTIKEGNYQKLLKSIREFPDMAKARPLVINQAGEIIGGNMRYRAMLECGWTEVPIIRVDWSEAQQQEFIVKDNVQFGDWDWDILANSWEATDLHDWGVISTDYSVPAFQPNVEPTANNSDITASDIDSAAQALADIAKPRTGLIDCCCPNCGTEFQLMQ